MAHRVIRVDRRLAAVGGMVMLFAAMVHAIDGPVRIHLDDKRLAWCGRFDRTDPAAPCCEWAGCSLRASFRGPGLSVTLSSTGTDRVQVIVDGVPGEVVPVSARASTIRVAGTPGRVHTVEIAKATEPFVGRLRFLGLELAPGGDLLPGRSDRRLRIEYVGDSITCGFGNEAPDEQHHFSPATENHLVAFGALAARRLDAEHQCIAWSGKKVWPDNTLAEIYDRTLPTDASPAKRFDLRSWVPDVIVVDLGTNDFREKNPDQGPWTAAYRELVTRLRQRAPAAHVFCAIGPMMNDSWSPGQRPLTTLRQRVVSVVEALRKAGDHRIHFLEFTPQGPADGYGADWHPSLRTHRRMADELVDALRRAGAVRP